MGTLAECLKASTLSDQEKKDFWADTRDLMQGKKLNPTQASVAAATSIVNNSEHDIVETSKLLVDYDKAQKTAQQTQVEVPAETNAKVKAGPKVSQSEVVPEATAKRGEVFEKDGEQFVRTSEGKQVPMTESRVKARGAVSELEESVESMKDLPGNKLSETEQLAADRKAYAEYKAGKSSISILDEPAPKEKAKVKATGVLTRLEGSGPQTFEVVSREPKQDGDLDNEVYYKVVNSKTGEEQIVESQDVLPLKAHQKGFDKLNSKGAKVILGEDGRAYILEDLASVIYKAGQSVAEFTTRLKNVLGKAFKEVADQVKALYNKLNAHLDTFTSGAEVGAVRVKSTLRSDGGISTRIPTAKTAKEKTDKRFLNVGLKSAKADRKSFEKNAATISGYLNYRPAESANTPDKVVNRFINHVKNNLVFLYDQVPKEIRDRSKLWYDGANNISKRWAERFGVEQTTVAGVLAGLSPQKDWFMNVSLAERVLDTYVNHQNTPWSDGMSKTAERIFSKPQYKSMMAEITGKTISELDRIGHKSAWIRIYDETFNTRKHRILSPEGTFQDFVKTKKGVDGKVAWGSLSEISKAVSVLQDPNLENISLRMGGQHKVRNFYNNIISPTSDRKDVTIDTHAVAAGLLNPLSGSSREVLHNFGSGAASSSITGSKGTYGIYAEAYRLAAKEKGVLPREMQSITWEAVRGLFSAPYKAQKKNTSAIEGIWQKYRKGGISLETARSQIFGHAEGITQPDWYGRGSGVNAGVPDSSFFGKLSGVQLSGQQAKYSVSRGGDSLTTDTVRSETEGIRSVRTLLRPYGKNVVGESRAYGRGVERTHGGVRITYTPTKELASALKDAGAEASTFVEVPNPKEFRDAIKAAAGSSKFGSAVEVKSLEDYKGYRLFLTDGGKAGFALSPDGDLVSGFKHQTFKNPNFTINLLSIGTDEGGVTTDCFDTVLPHLYSKMGFVVTSRMPWNDKHKPGGWDYELFKAFNNGRPDVVLMAYNPDSFDLYESSDGVMAIDKNPDNHWGEAEGHRNKYITQLSPTVKKPQSKQPLKDPANAKVEIEKGVGKFGLDNLIRKGLLQIVSPEHADQILGFFSQETDLKFQKMTSPPKKTVKAYKLFRTLKTRPGELFPLFIGKSTATPVGEWISAEHIPTKGYAPRSGWHTGVLPTAPHLMKKDGTMQEGRVWAEVEIPADVDWQTKADSRKTKDIRGEVPEGGNYKFKTSKLQGGAWFISGAIKVNKVLSAFEVDSIMSENTDAQGDIKYSKDGRVEGFTLNGKVYLVDGNIRKGDAMNVLNHELGVHVGQLGFKGTKQFKNVLSMLEKRAKLDTAEGQAIRDAQTKIPKNTKPEHKAEETLAYLITNSPSINIVHRFIAALKKFLVEKLGISPRILKNIDLQALAVSVVKQEGKRGVKGVQMGGKRGVMFSKSEGWGDLDEAQQTFKDKGVWGAVEKKTVKERIANAKVRATDKLRQGMIDQFHSLKYILKDQDAYMMSHLTKSSGGALMSAVKKGIPFLNVSGAIDLVEGSESIEDIFKPLGEELTRFFGWIAANRSERLMEEGREKRFDEDDIAAGKTLNLGILQDGGSRAALYKTTREKFEEMGAAITEIAVRTNLINDEEAARWREEGFYVPFYRMIEESQSAGKGPGNMGGLTNMEGYKRLTGKDAGIADPLTNVLLNWNHLLDAGLKNQAGKKAVESAAAQGYATRLTSKGFWKEREDGFTLEGIDDVDATITEVDGKFLVQAYDGFDKTYSSFKKAKSATHKYLKSEGVMKEGAMTNTPHGKDSIYIRDNGRQIWYDLDRSSEGTLILDSLTSLNYEGLNTPSMKAMRGFKRLLTRGVTVSPGFKIRNLFRDSLHAPAVSTASRIPFKNIYVGIKGQGRTADRMAAGGGSFSQEGYVHGNDPDASKRLIGMTRDSLLTSPHGIIKMFQKWENFGATLENINRVASFEADLKAGKSLLEANFNARDQLDFARSGSFNSIRVLTQTIPFLNARFQGLDKMARAAMDKNQRAQFVQVVGMYAAASVALMLAMRGDEDYEDAQEWEKRTYHMFKIPGSETMYRIPRPFEVGAIAYMTEQMTRQFIDVNAEIEDLGSALQHTFSDTFAFSIVPQAFSPVLAVYANRDAFRNSQIESMSMQRLSKKNRSKPWTSKTAKGVSAAMSEVAPEGFTLSPVQIQYLIGGYLGWAGATILAASDFMARQATGEIAPEVKLSEYKWNPLESFSRDADARTTKYITKFYDNLSEINQEWADIRNYKDNRIITPKEKSRLQYRKGYNKVSKKLSELRKQATEVYESDKLSSIRKRQLLKQIDAKKNLFAKRAVRLSKNAF